MKKPLFLTLFMAVLVSLTGLAYAGDSNRGHKGKHDTYQFRTGYRIRHDAYHSHHGRHYPNCRHHSHRRHDYRDGLRLAAGALVLGSIIHAIDNHQPRTVVYRSRPLSQRQTHWYRIDPDGQCVEVRLNQQGREVWTDVNSSYCY